GNGGSRRAETEHLPRRRERGVRHRGVALGGRVHRAAIHRTHHPPGRVMNVGRLRSEEHTSELQSQSNLVCRLLLEKKKVNSTASLPKPSSKKRLASSPTTSPIIF